MELSDRDLLRRFVQDADDDAFAGIVRRYHGLVMSVCRRVTSRRADAEDAFQATFLALAHRPRSIRRAASLSSWLYVVAWRTSLRLVKQRRSQPMEHLSEEPANRTPGPLDQIASSQNLQVLDEELNRLPARYRDVLVMAYFANQSNQQIADELNVSRGTVDGRLRRGRNQLRIRLARRGVVLGVLAAATALPGQAAAATSPELLSATTQLGLQTLNGTLPATTDLTFPESLIRPETAVMSSNLLMTGVACASIAVGLLGLTVGADDGRDDLPGPVIEPAALSAVTEPLAAPQIVFVSQAAAKTPALSAAADENEDDGYFIGGSVPTRFHAWPDDAPPVERWMHEILNEEIPPLEFGGETPLAEVLDFIADYFTQQHRVPDQDFRVTIWPDSRTLVLENIDSLDDVVVRDIKLQGLTLRSALKAVFGRTTDPALTYVIRDELMVVTTVDEAWGENSLTTRVYPVGHLLAVDSPDWNRSGPHPEMSEPPPGPGQGYFQLSDSANDPIESSDVPSHEGPEEDVPGDRRAMNMCQLMSVVQQMTTPPLEWADVDGQGGSIDSFGESLVIRQTYDGHQEIVKLLNQLTEALK